MIINRINRYLTAVFIPENIAGTDFRPRRPLAVKPENFFFMVFYFPVSSSTVFISARIQSSEKNSGGTNNLIAFQSALWFHFPFIEVDQYASGEIILAHSGLTVIVAG
ncbi:hypothetical protein O5541_08990 [Escherichia coli]|nr:hypothetical protein [Escherichia coli]